jgi:spore germination cell wall hydrolase CwlJ-like protein
VGQTTAQCERAAIHFEAANQGILGQKAVLEVVRARAKSSGKSVCKVLLEKGQFSWATRSRLKIRLALRQKVRYDLIRRMDNEVLPDDSFQWFARKPHGFAGDKIRIGGHTFNNLKEK